MSGYGYQWFDFEPEEDGAEGVVTDPDKHILTIADPDGEELAVIVHRTCNGKYPVDGDLANAKRRRAAVIVAALDLGRAWLDMEDAFDLPGMAPYIAARDAAQAAGERLRVEITPG